MTAPSTDSFDLLRAIREHAGAEAEQLEAEATELERKAAAKRERARVLRDIHTTVERAA